MKKYANYDLKIQWSIMIHDGEWKIMLSQLNWHAYDRTILRAIFFLPTPTSSRSEKLITLPAGHCDA